MVERWPRWTEVIFPGILPLVLAICGVVFVAMKSRSGAAPRERETALLYGSLGVLALWSSFGPAAGLYTFLFHTIPVFSFLRAPSRMGIVVVLCLAILAALGLRRLLTLLPGRGILAVAIPMIALVEMITPMPWERPVIVPEVYSIVAKLPRAPLAEFPFYGGRPAWHLHTQYMLFSTSHWLPMMNGYSDYTPLQFRQDSLILDGFPSHDSFGVLGKARVRYVGIHWDMFGPREQEIRTRLEPYLHHLRLIADSPRVSFYEVVSFP
jgi:hypothetical protein